MPLDLILDQLHKPVKASAITEIIAYMKSMPSQHEPLVLQCAARLETDQSLATVLAVVHALNGGEFLLRCQDDEDTDAIVSEFERLLNDEGITKKTEPPLPAAAHGANR